MPRMQKLAKNVSALRRGATTTVCMIAALALPAGCTAAPNAADAGPNPESSTMITDFTPDTPDLGWYVQNDNVMGGRSEGGFDIDGDRLVFAGSTNTNGGGFSSIRTRRFEIDLSADDGIELRLKADGRQYTWQLQTDARNRGYPVSYWAEFDTQKRSADDDWETVRIPFSRFYPQFRGFKLDGPPLDPGNIRELGLYIYDKQDGPFRLVLDSVGTYRDD